MKYSIRKPTVWASQSGGLAFTIPYYGKNVNKRR